MLMGQVNLGVGNRIQRYLTLYKAYEAVTDKPSSDLSSLRHALAHPATALSSASTVRELRQLFGTKFFDIENSTHQRQFYSRMGVLLIVLDQRMGRLLGHARHALILQDRDDAMHEWELKGLWGGAPTVQLCPES